MAAGLPLWPAWRPAGEALQVRPGQWPPGAGDALDAQQQVRAPALSAADAAISRSHLNVMTEQGIFCTGLQKQGAHAERLPCSRL